MRDIKTLYLAAKRSGKPTDISSYTEAVQELLESDPNGFVSNLEYIITSDIGLTRLDSFTEKYGMAIPLCNGIIDMLEQAVQKCNTLKKDPTLYEDYLEKFQTYRREHKNHFDMYEYYMDGISDSGYINAYYTFNENGIQGRKLPAGMINRFGESAIPDAIITGTSLGTKATRAVYGFLNGHTINDQIARQWVVECSANISTDIIPEYSKMEESCLSTRVYDKELEFNKVLRESVITGDTTAEVQYTESELNDISDLIALREYQIACAESVDDAITIQNEVYSLYESLGNVEGDDGECGIDIMESGSIEKSTAKKVADRLNKFGKDMTKDLKSAIKEVKKETVKNNKKNKDDSYKDSKFIKWSQFRGAVAVGDNKGPFGLMYNSMSAKYHIVKTIMNDNGYGDTIDNLYFYIIIESVTNRSLNMAEKENFRKMASNILNKSKLAEYINDGIIQISEPEFLNNPDPSVSMIKSFTTFQEYAYVYAEYVTTLSWSVKISREFAFKGIDKSIIESICMESFVGNISYMLEGMYEPVVVESRFSNTDDQYTGKAPGFLRNNHDLAWGEEDEKDNKTDISIDKEYRRPSADPDANSTGDMKSDNSHVDNTDDDIDDDDKNIPAGVNNYYYYTYTNSNNKNSNSFNRSSNSHDDHSTGKRIHSNDYISRERKVGDADNMENTMIESAKKTGPYAARDEYFNKYNDLFYGEWKDKGAAEKQELLFKSLFKKDIKSVELEEIPDKITIKIGNTDCEFSTKVGYCYVGPNERATKFEQVPCAVYTYQSNKDKFSKELGGKIGDALLSYIKDTWAEDPGYFGGSEPTNDIDDNLKRFKFKPKKMYFNELGHIGLEFDSDIEIEHGVGICILPSLSLSVSYANDNIFESAYVEKVGDADNIVPESDHPVKDTLQDIDRALGKTQQAAKKTVQDVVNAGSAFMKPIKRTHEWVTKLVHDWKDISNTKIMEKIADPHSRNGIFDAITWCIKTGSLAKAGLLFNPVFLFLSIVNHSSKKDKESRLRKVVLGKIKEEIEVIDEKIQDAKNMNPPDNKAKYKLMRLKHELNRKLVRVGGSDIRSWRKII